MALTPQQLHQKNMNFFATHYKTIHDHLIRLKHDEYELLLDSSSGDADVKFRGQLTYNGSAKRQAELDYEAFLHTCAPGQAYRSMQAVRPSLFYLPRTAHSFISSILSKHVQEDSDLNVTWPIPDFYPQVVVMGIGLGLHITKLLTNHKVHNVILYEPDFTMILMSTFVTDWEELYRIQRKPGHSLTILTGRKEQGRQIVLSALAARAPHFPLSTQFFIHNSQPEYVEIAKAAHATRHLIPPSWGQYDDELNQTNHIVQNLAKGIHLIPGVEQFTFDKPVIVVGAGPSLDRHIESIKSLRENYLVFSAGSAITALIEHDIIPDLHVELESDYLTYKKLAQSRHADAIRNIPLCAAIQCSPFLFEMFDRHIAFIKDSLYSAAVLEPNKSNRLRHATPTCTNTAAALAAHFKAPEIRLIGVDLGYYELSEHHSKASLYYEDSKIGKMLNSAMDKVNNDDKTELITKPGYKGTVKTYWVFDLARESIERLISIHRDVLFINHSDGAIIKGCLRDEELDPPRKSTVNSENSALISELLLAGQPVNQTHTKALHRQILNCQAEIQKVVEKTFAEPREDDPIEYISRTSSTINSALLKSDRKSDGIGTLISGTVRQYMYMGMSTILMLPSAAARVKFSRDWSTHFPILLSTIKRESDAIYRQSKISQAKERLTLTILEPLPEKK